MGIFKMAQLKYRKLDKVRMLSQDFMGILGPKWPHFILQLCICEFRIFYE